MSDIATQGLSADAAQKADYVHTLSLRITNLDYRRLRRFVAAQEETIGRRLTHQAVLETALSRFLAAQESGQAGMAASELGG